MPEPLITITQLTDRMGTTLDATETTQANAYIKDASALVREIAGDDFTDDAGQLVTPPALVPVVVSMVRRAIRNPYGASSEDVGDASWQGMGTIYATAREKKIIRSVSPTTGTPGIGAITLEGYLPLPPFVPTGDDLTGSL